MKLRIKIHPKAKQRKIVKHSECKFEVWVREAPDKGKANEALIEALSDYLKIPKSRLTLASGHTSRQKTIQIN